MTRRFFALLLCISFTLLMFVGCDIPDLPTRNTSSTLFSGKDFRTFNWGDPDYLIRKEEGALLTYDSDNRIMYWSTFLGYQANITYIFYENKLSNGYISIDSDESKDNIFKAISSEFKTLYGDPIESTPNSMKFIREDNSTVYLSKDGLQVGVLFSKGN